MSQIIFHGCSWTWGSGLQYYYLKEKHDYSIEKMNNFLPHEVRLEYFSRKVDDYRKKHHFPNLVSEHFDVPYLLAREGNGGDNHSIWKNIKNAENYEHNSVYAHIVQLSAPMRGPDSPILQDKDAGISDIIRFQVEKVLEGVKNRMFPQPASPVFFICWFKEHADYILNEYPDKLIYILHKNKEYTSFDQITDRGHTARERAEKDKITISYDIGVNDGHFSKKGHKLIADSVIRKLSKNVEFTTIKI
jgi:hypothetical protein